MANEVPKINEDARYLSWYKLKQELKVDPFFHRLDMTILLRNRSVRDDLESEASSEMRV